MTIGRDFLLRRLREGMRPNFRVEDFNVFNTPNPWAAADDVDQWALVSSSRRLLSFDRRIGHLSSELQQYPLYVRE